MSNTIYVCEVAVHLTTGLLYVSRNNQPDNVGKLFATFKRHEGMTPGEYRAKHVRRRGSDWRPPVRL